jgi:hypothetical protein
MIDINTIIGSFNMNYLYQGLFGVLAIGLSRLYSRLAITGKKLGIGKIRVGNSKLSSVTGPLGEVLFTGLIAANMYAKGNILFSVVFVVGACIDIFSIKKRYYFNMGNCILYEKGIYISGNFRKFSKADYIDNGTLIYRKGSKRFEIGLESEQNTRYQGLKDANKLRPYSDEIRFVKEDFSRYL